MLAFNTELGKPGRRTDSGWKMQNVISECWEDSGPGDPHLSSSTPGCAVHTGFPVSGSPGVCSPSLHPHW